MPSKEQLIERWTSSGTIKDKKVIESFKKIPREVFVPKGKMEEAYGDYPISIGDGQTISQPTTVAVMTQALELKEGDKVLEVGTGSGYQAAIIAEIVGEKGRLITTEIIPELAKMAQKNIDKIKLKNIKIIELDGSKGYKKEAPYDKIIITAACPRIPKRLIGQLKENGIIVAPVGSMIEQKLIKARKKNGEFIEENLGDFMFVPLKGRYGY